MVNRVQEDWDNHIALSQLHQSLSTRATTAILIPYPDLNLNPNDPDTVLTRSACNYNPEIAHNQVTKNNRK